MRLTNYLIKKKVQSLAAGAAGRKHESCTLEEAGHVLVLYQADDREMIDLAWTLCERRTRRCRFVSMYPEELRFRKRMPRASRSMPERT